MDDSTEQGCSGRIVQGDGADTLLHAVKSLDTPHILIDLIGVNAIDAGGLGVLAELERWVRDENRRVHLVNPAKGVREVLEVTRLSSVLQLFPTPNTYLAYAGFFTASCPESKERSVCTADIAACRNPTSSALRACGRADNADRSMLASAGDAFCEFGNLLYR